MKVLCYVNHYFGQPVGFEGRSTDQGNASRREIVNAAIEGLRALPGAEVYVCGIEGKSLTKIDIDFPQARDDPKLLIYESLARMAGRLEDYDYFINIEDDILVSPETFANVVEFDRDALVNEILHPNRLEDDEAGAAFCVDLKAMPGWTHQRRPYRGRELRVARNPHSGVLIMSREKLRYALEHIDRAYRGRFLVWEMDSAFAYYNSPFALFRPYEDLAFHTVRHLDRWTGPKSKDSKDSRASKAAPRRAAAPRWKRIVRQLLPPIAISIARRVLGRPAAAGPKARTAPAFPATPSSAGASGAGDGKMTRHAFLAGLHEAFVPRTYLEIGVNDGQSMTLSRTLSIGVDPAFQITKPVHCDLELVRATSDDFFAQADPLAHFRGTGAAEGHAGSDVPRVDLAFIDGMHLFEFAFRDLMNTERHAGWWSVIVLDDMLPRNHVEANRDRSTRDWTGDVFKVLPVLTEHRPDLIVIPVDTAPTGVVVVIGADAASNVLPDRSADIIRDWATPDPQVVPSSILEREGAFEPSALLASPVWAALREARTGGTTRQEGLDQIREFVAGVTRR